MSKCYSNEEEREKLIIENQKLVYHVFKQMRMTFRIDDIFDVGLIGLIKGIDTFDSDKGYQLSTYLVKCIRHQLTQQIVYENAEKRQAETISLNKTVFSDEDDLMIENIIGYDLNLDEELIKQEILDAIDYRLYFLSERDEKIFKHIHGLDGYKQLTHFEIAKKFGLSHQRIGEINCRIKRILKYHLKEYM